MKKNHSQSRPANRSALRSGKHVDRAMTLGQPPKGLERAAKDTRRMMREIRERIVELRQTTTHHEESIIEECAQWEMHRRLCFTLLKRNTNLDHEQKVSLSREAAKAATERTRCLRALNLDPASVADAWDSMHGAKRIEVTGGKK